VVTGADQADVADKVARVEEQLHEIKGRGILNRPTSTQQLTSRQTQLEAERSRLLGLEQAAEQMITSGLAGTVSYTFDGLEGVLQESDLSALLESQTDLTEIAHRARLIKVDTGETVSSGTPVVKIIDNFHFWLVAEIPGTGIPVSVGERVRVRVWSDEAPGDATSVGTVVAFRVTGGRQRIIVSLQEYWPWFNQLRWANVEIIKQRYEGVIIPRSSVIQRKGETGVIVQLPRGAVFQPITVRGGKGGEVVVDGVSAGTRVRR
jgi:putative membrane fusion protein